MRAIYFFFIIFFNFFAIAFATPATELAHLLNAVHSMRAHFTQVIFDHRHQVVQQSDGDMAVQRPGKFRWEVIKPIPQLIIANASRIWIYDPDLAQVTIRSLKRAAGDTPALLLSQVTTVLDSNYKVQVLQKRSGRWFTLIPKRADNMFASIQIGFIQNQVRAMQLQDHLGHTTHIQFSHIKTNLSLPSSLFIFKPPANIDVIDETR